MPYPTPPTLKNSVLMFSAIAEDITGRSDGEAVTTHWTDSVNSNASTLTAGSPTYVANAYNGHPGVRFEKSGGDMLEWPLNWFDDFLVIVVGVFEDVGDDDWEVAFATELSTSIGGDRNMWAFRHPSALGFACRYGGNAELAQGSSPTYDELQIWSAHLREGTVYWHYKSGGSYAHQETDTSIEAQMSNFDTAYMGGDPADGTHAMTGTILAVHMWHRSGLVNDDDEIKAALDDYLQEIEDYLNVAPIAPPATPTVTITSVSATGVSAKTSAFSAGEGGTHVATQWRIKKVSDGSTVYDPGDDTSNLTSITNAGSTVPLDTASEVYTLEARHGEST